VKKIIVFLILIISFLPFAYAKEVEDYSKTIAIFKSSPEAQKYFDDAYAYAVFPFVGKGGFIVGGSHGSGQVYVNDQVTGFASLTHLSIGLQAGGQAFSEIIFLKDERAYEEFTNGTFEVDAAASAVAITAGAQAQAGTTGVSSSSKGFTGASKQNEGWYVKGLAIFVHTKGGAMLEAAVGGQGIAYTPLK
jgi:lipid-binding SYLF domain-containing protein